MNDPKTPIDAAAIAVAGFSWAQLLPNIAALFSIIWLVIRIYETKTFRKLLARLFTKNG
tara:strand:- start:31 stop:207 length:177 start_codon:yes stop_codon:yes gene_type:complete